VWRECWRVRTTGEGNKRCTTRLIQPHLGPLGFARRGPARGKQIELPGRLGGLDAGGQPRLGELETNDVVNALTLLWGRSMQWGCDVSGEDARL
jgi:hypothetical protein